jgi:hypothetical protein
VVLQIEEDAEPALAGPLDRRRARGREELRADLASGDEALEARQQRLGLVETGNVEGDQ